MKTHVKADLIILTLLVLPFWNLMAQATFAKHTISPVGQPMDVYVSDINGDGKKDLATVSTTDGEVAWWENSGNMTFVKRTLKSGFAGGRSIRAGDIDLDGDTDMIAASVSLNRIEWYENDGNQKFTTRILDNAFRGAHTVEIFDLDRDGDMDILCSGWDNSAALSEIAWWENNGSQIFTKRVISSFLDQAPFVEAADMDLDGDFDLIGSDETTGEVYWWKNNGNQGFTEHLIDGQFNLAHTVLARDIDKDGDPDILASACTSSLQAWYENKGNGAFEKHAMENLNGAIWLDMGDFDRDGDQDMIGTGMGAAQLALYTNNGQQRFAKTWVEGGLTSGFALNINDMDNDGDLDVVAIGYSSNFLGWWENTTVTTGLIQSPSWVIPGSNAGDFLVANNDKGNIIATRGLIPLCGIANPGYCQGLALTDNLLYVNAGAYLNVYQSNTGIRIENYRPDVQFLEGMAEGQGGILYLSAPMDGKILAFNRLTRVFSDLATGLSYPRAIAWDRFSARLFVLDGEEFITVKEIDPADGAALIKEVTAIRSGGDIEPDGNGNFYISSPLQNSIYVNTTHWSSESVPYHRDLKAPWGMIFDGVTHELVVAMNGSNTLERVAATATGTNLVVDPGESFTVYPNPASDLLYITMPFDKSWDVEFQITDQCGAVRSVDKRNFSGLLTGLDLSSLNLEPGLFYLMAKQKNRVYTTRFIYLPIR